MPGRLASRAFVSGDFCVERFSCAAFLVMQVPETDPALSAGQEPCDMPH